MTDDEQLIYDRMCLLIVLLLLLFIIYYIFYLITVETRESAPRCNHTFVIGDPQKFLVGRGRKFQSIGVFATHSWNCEPDNTSECITLHSCYIHSLHSHNWPAWDYRLSDENGCV